MNDIEKTCIHCGNKYFVKISRKDTAKYCSRSCLGKDLTGERARNWKGDTVGYDGIHAWIRNNLGRRPLACDQCGALGKTDKGRWSIQWANKSGDYKRDINDWMSLCIPCHVSHDRQPKKYTYMGIEDTIASWSVFFGIKQTTLLMRLQHYGWGIERALFTPGRGSI